MSRRELHIQYQCYKDGKTWPSSCKAFVFSKMTKEKIEEMEKDFALNLDVDVVKIVSWHDTAARR